MGGSQSPAAYLMLGKKIDRKIQGEGYNCRTNKTNGDGEWSNVAVQRRWIERRLVPGAGKGAYFAYKFHSCLSFKKVLKKVLKESWVLKFSENTVSEKNIFRKCTGIFDQMYKGHKSQIWPKFENFGKYTGHCWFPEEKHLFQIW